MNGVLIIDKPEGLTSHDVVSRCRRILKTKRIGHTGTLDPFATGVLVILVGKATRLAQFLDKDQKEYEAIVQFGFETETGDKTGQLRITNYELRDVSVENIEAVLPEFLGEIEQTPPMYSAKKIEGKKLYELARKGVEIERNPVKVKIYELEIIKNTQHSALSTQHLLALRVVCSAGTYIRTLAEDIGRRIGTGAHLTELRRTRAGKFDLSKAVTIEELEKIVSENRLDEIIISMNEAVSHLPEIRLSEDEIAKTRSGLKLKRSDFKAAESAPVRMTDERQNLVAVGVYDKGENIIQPKIVLV
jgi:tRNA pseudouridine55 synthase